MATILFSAIGTLVGGPLGGAIGALVGRQVDSAIIGSPNREGPRLKELTATTSSYGSVMGRHFGRMRVAGSVIWATELVEHRDREGGGKGRPSVTTYSYTGSFAVALSSRPIKAIGRIWADGNLLRGAAGDLKAPGTMRVYTGEFDQLPDPLMAAVEGADRCPAYRGLAYVVFEDLELSDFFNRIPALTFEVISDEGAFTLQDIAAGVIKDVDAHVPLDGIAGLTSEGPLIQTLQVLEPAIAMDCDAAGDILTIARERLQEEPIAMSEPAASVADGDFGKVAGYARKRQPPPPNPPEILRYYDIDRDYQPGVQRAGGRPRPGEPRTTELPAALTAENARNLAVRISRRSVWSRDALAWRSTELDPVVGPGTVVTLPGIVGEWRVSDWEWRDNGVELSLLRVVPTGADAAPTTSVDPGRANPPADTLPPPTTLVAFELPWDGIGSADVARPFAAVSAPAASWSGAALFADHGDGSLESLGPSGRARSILGTAQTALGSASPLVIDRHNAVDVALIDPAMSLVDASLRQLAAGANRALLGQEIIQFARAAPLGGGTWRLHQLLRGRGGTEAAIADHAAGESFVLLDATPVDLDPALVGSAPGTRIVAAGRGDDEPVTSEIALQGIAVRPLSPVHPRMTSHADGSMTLAWTRRARGAWLWADGVDVPLNEQSERYLVTYGAVSSPTATWSVTQPVLTLAPALLTELAALLPGGEFVVRQQGSHALSLPLLLAFLP